MSFSIDFLINIATKMPKLQKYGIIFQQITKKNEYFEIKGKTGVVKN
jgi:hypothetical protein